MIHVKVRYSLSVSLQFPTQVITVNSLLWETDVRVWDVVIVREQMFLTHISCGGWISPV